VGGFDYSRAIPDVSETERERNGADRPILHLQRGFLGGGVSEVHPGHWSIENQLHWMLDIVFREDGERCVEYEHSEDDGVTPAEETEDGEKTGQHQTPHDVRRFGFGFPVRGFVFRVNADALP
jgi:hypothetical protein